MISIAKPIIAQEEIDAAVAALKSGALTGGPLIESFEKELALYHGYKHAVAVSSGTAALHVLMHSAGLHAGDEIIVPDFTFIATANAARYVGAVPRFCDVDEKTFNIDVSKAEKLVTPKTKAIIPVSLYGQAYNVDAVKEFAEKHSLLVLSDQCQAIGTKWRGSRNLHDQAMTLSFYPTKNLTTMEGGAVLTDDDGIAEECRLWRNIGQRKPYDYAHLGYNYRLTTVAAAIGSAQLKKLDSFTQKRRENARILNELLADIVEIPFEDERAEHVYHQYTIKTQKRDELKQFLAENGVGSNVYYPVPLHTLPTFASTDACPITERLCKTVLSLPIHPLVTHDDLQLIAEKVKEFIETKLL